MFPNFLFKMFCRNVKQYFMLKDCLVMISNKKGSRKAPFF